MKEAVLYKKNKGYTTCTACNHYCKIKPDNYGICNVRKNVKGKLMLMVYSKPCAISIDPVEKKPLYHFLPGSNAYSVGTFGCNFGCDFCQNWDISQASKTKQFEQIINTINITTPEQIVEQAVKNNCKSIAYTYNEPTVFFEYAYDTAKLARKKGLKNIFVTNGYYSAELLKKIKGLVDAVNIDLKSFSDAFYKNICKARLQPVLDSIKSTYEAGIWVEITTLIIPNLNDSINELTHIADFIKNIDDDIPWHVSAFHPAYKRVRIGRTPEQTVLNAARIGKNQGLNNVYAGNVNSREQSNTYCKHCNALLIERGYMTMITNHIINNSCPNCGETIGGVWK